MAFEISIPCVVNAHRGGFVERRFGTAGTFGGLCADTSSTADVCFSAFEDKHLHLNAGLPIPFSFSVAKYSS